MGLFTYQERKDIWKETLNAEYEWYERQNEDKDIEYRKQILRLQT